MNNFFEGVTSLIIVQIADYNQQIRTPLVVATGCTCMYIPVLYQYLLDVAQQQMGGGDSGCGIGFLGVTSNKFVTFPRQSSIRPIDAADGTYFDIRGYCMRQPHATS